MTKAVSTREAKRDMYRQQIVAAAEFEFARSGFEKAKVSDIARTADLSLATVYKSFDGKDDIWNALNRQRVDELIASGLRATNDIDSPFERLLHAVRAEFMFFAEHPNFLRLHIGEGLSWATAGAEVGRGGQRDAWRTAIGLMEAFAEAVIASGEARPLPPTVLAGLVISALQVFLTDWFNSGSTRPAEQVAEEMVDYLRNSFAETGVQSQPRR